MATLRDPAARAFSSYLYMRKHGLGEPTFAATMKTFPDFIEHGRYGTQLRRYLKFFPREVSIRRRKDACGNPACGHQTAFFC